MNSPTLRADHPVNDVTDDATLINDVTAIGICEDVVTADSDCRWSSEELLSTCDALVKSSLPIYVTQEINHRRLSSKDTNLFPEADDLNCRLSNSLEMSSFNLNFNSSLNSSSSSFNSCESALEKCVADMRESSPAMYHSCSSLNNVDEKGTNFDLNDRSTHLKANFPSKLANFPPKLRIFSGNEIDIGSDWQMVNGRGRVPDDSKTSDSVQHHEAFLINQPPIRIAYSVDDKMGINETLNKDEVKCLPFPEYEEGIVEGVKRYIFPSSFGMPSSAVALSAKDAKPLDISRDLFCLPLEKEFENRCCSIYSTSGELKKSEKYEIKFSNEGPNECSTASAENNSICEYCEYNKCKGKYSVDGEMQNNLKCKTNIPEGGISEGGIGKRGPNLPSSNIFPSASDKIDTSVANYLPNSLLNSKFFTYKPQIDNKFNVDDISYCAGINDGFRCEVPGELDNLHGEGSTIDRSCHVPCKRLSNVFHAVPVFITDDEPESYHRIPNSGLDDESVLPVNKKCRNKSPENVNNVRNFFSGASNMDASSDCQSLFNIGTASEYAVSNEFGAAEGVIDLQQRERINKKRVGEVLLFVGNTLLSYPIFIDNGANTFKNLHYYSTSELNLAWSGKDWKLSVNDELPVIVYWNDMTDDVLLKDKHPRKQLTSKLYGFTIISNENIKVKSLVPIFNEKPLNDWDKIGRRSSICTSVALRAKNKNAGKKEYRNSAACDMEMYRNAQQFVPIKENDSYINCNENNIIKLCSVVVDSSALSDCSPSVVIDENLLTCMPTEELQDKSAETNTNELLKPGSVLRSKSDSKLKNINDESSTASRSISLHGYDAVNSSNLSSFKGVTMEDLPSSETKAAAFLSSFLEQSMVSEKVCSPDNNSEKSLLGTGCGDENKNFGDIKTAPSSFVIESKNSLPNAHPNFIDLDIRNTTFNFSNIPNPDHSFENQNFSALGTDDNFNQSTSQFINFQAAFLESTSINPVSALQSYPSIAHSVCNSSVSNSFSPNIVSNIKTDFLLQPKSTLPTSHLPESFSLTSPIINIKEASANMQPSSSLGSDCYVTNSNPMTTKMSVLPVTQVSTPVEAVSSSQIEHSIENYGNPCVLLTNNAIVQQDNMLSKDSCFINEIENMENKEPFSIKEERGLTLKKRAVDVAKQQGALPPRYSYSTKFPMDIICQGRLQEVKKKTVPQRGFSNPPFEEHRFRRQRISSVGQVKPLASYLKENYPTVRSKSAGRMDFGRAKTPVVRSLSENREDKNCPKAFDANSILSEVEEDIVCTPISNIDSMMTTVVDSASSRKELVVSTPNNIQEINISSTHDSRKGDVDIPADSIGTVFTQHFLGFPCDNTLSLKSNLLSKNICDGTMKDKYVKTSRNSSIEDITPRRDIISKFVNIFVPNLLDMETLFPLIKSRCNCLPIQKSKIGDANLLCNLNKAKLSNERKYNDCPGRVEEIKQDANSSNVVDRSTIAPVKIHQNIKRFSRSPDKDKTLPNSSNRPSETINISITDKELIKPVLEINVGSNKSYELLSKQNISSNIDKVLDENISSCNTSLDSRLPDDNFKNERLIDSNKSSNVLSFTKSSRSPDFNSRINTSDIDNARANRSLDSNRVCTNHSPNKISSESISLIKPVDAEDSKIKILPDRLCLDRSPERTCLTIALERTNLKKSELINSTISSVRSEDEDISNKSSKETFLEISPERTCVEKSPNGFFLSSSSKTINLDKPDSTFIPKLPETIQEAELSSTPVVDQLVRSREMSFNNHDEVTLENKGHVLNLLSTDEGQRASLRSINDAVVKIINELDSIKSVMEFCQYKTVDLQHNDNKLAVLSTNSSSLGTQNDVSLKSELKLNSNIKSEFEFELDSNLKSESKLELDSNRKSELELDSNLKSELELKLDSNLKSELELKLDANLKSELKLELSSVMSELELDSNQKSEFELVLDSNRKYEIENKADKIHKTELNIDTDVFSTQDESNKNVEEGVCGLPTEPVFQVSLPETTKPLSFVVEEILDFIDERSSPSTYRSAKDRVSPSPVPPLSATLSFPICRQAITPRSTEPSGTTMSTTVKEKAKKTDRMSSTKPTSNEEQNSEFLDFRAKDGAVGTGYSSATSTSASATGVLGYSSRSEDESQSSCDRPTDGDALASVSSSSTGSALSWGSGNKGPVARRDLFPLEDEDVTPQWHALLEVNPPDSDEDRTGYESDDDFENMDAEMRRLEEKLKKFERELGVTSSGEDVGSKNGTTRDDETKLSKQNNAAVPRLRPEDIDVLKSFSLPDVYPPVNILKTKHLSLMTKEEDVFDEDEGEAQRRGSGSMNSSSLFVKPLRKFKKGERRCRSLNLQNLPSKRGSRFSNSKYSDFNSVAMDTTQKMNIDHDCSRGEELTESMVTEQDNDASCTTYEVMNQYTDFNTDKDGHRIDSVASEEEKCEDKITLKEAEYHDKLASSDTRYCGDNFPFVDDGDEFGSNVVDSCVTSSDQYGSFDCLVGEDLCDGFIWWDKDSDMTVFDFEGLDELHEVYQVAEHCLFFIFEDDSEEQVEDVINSSAPVEKETFLLPLYSEHSNSHPSTESSGSHASKETDYFRPSSPLDKDQSCGLKRKRDISLVSAFKNSFRKAAKYLGPNSTHKERDEDENDDYLKQLLSSPLFEDGSDEGAAGKYNVPNARIQNDPSVTDESPSSGEFYAYPVVCVMTSDEENSSVNRVDAVRKSPSLKVMDDVDIKGTLVPALMETTNESPSLQVDSISKIPPPVPPRRGVLISDFAKRASKVTEPSPTQHHNDRGVLGSPPSLLPTSTDGNPLISPTHIEACDNAPHKPYSLRQLKRKQQDRIETQKTEEALEDSGCTFCVGVPAVYRGRTDQQAGNHNRHPSPHPRVLLPERRTWPPRK